VDIRDTDPERRESVMQAVRQNCDEIRKRRGVTITEELVNADAPAHCSPHIVQTLETICAENGLRYKKMVSRAYHDSLFMARIAPIAMIFIPCRQGVSHRPDEFAATEDIVHGTRLLAEAMARLASE
jgi:N-carbamoyl-L-amino-acid hydrolase